MGFRQFDIRISTSDRASTFKSFEYEGSIEQAKEAAGSLALFYSKSGQPNSYLKIVSDAGYVVAHGAIVPGRGLVWSNETLGETTNPLMLYHFSGKSFDDVSNVEVFHPDMKSIFASDEWEDLFKHATSPHINLYAVQDLYRAGLYLKVAFVRSGLEEAFRLTQNTDSVWADASDPALIVEPIDGYKSTSVGDLMRSSDGRWFIVAPRGFVELRSLDSCERVEVVGA